MGVAQYPFVPPILTLTVLMIDACDNVNEVVQLILLLSRVSLTQYTNLKTNRTNKAGRKKKKTTETWRKDLRFYSGLCKCRQSAGPLCSQYSWCNLAKSYIFGFLLEWRARWYDWEGSHKYHFFMRREIFTVIFPRCKFLSYRWISPENYPYYGENTFSKKKLQLRENCGSYPRILQCVPRVLAHTLVSTRHTSIHNQWECP